MIRDGTGLTRLTSTIWNSGDTTWSPDEPGSPSTARRRGSFGRLLDRNEVLACVLGALR